MSLLSALLYTPAHGLVMLTIMDLPATPFQSSDLVKGEYGVKMRLEPAKVSPAAYHVMPGTRLEI
jgi:hypothetical protein